MADTRSYEADVARVLRDYYAREMGADDVAKVAEVAAKVAAEVLTGTTFYVNGAHLAILARADLDALEDARAEGHEMGSQAGRDEWAAHVDRIRDRMRDELGKAEARAADASSELDDLLDELQPLELLGTIPKGTAQKIRDTFDDGSTISIIEDMAAGRTIGWEP